MTSDDTAGVRQGRMDTLKHLVDFNINAFMMSEITTLSLLYGQRVLDWSEIDAHDRIIRAALLRAATVGRA